MKISWIIWWIFNAFWLLLLLIFGIILILAVFVPTHLINFGAIHIYIVIILIVLSKLIIPFIIHIVWLIVNIALTNTKRNKPKYQEKV
ncbi:hypothetical protein MUA95_11955 [Staphylococcus agnetis]|uniref:Uncharacterized protein n=1 Tax=Staphylococcus agnetis TaxID=985762 RepID=A0ABD7TTV8_9STAP|nr:hypothetical protein [Staphylococcus agnetis]UXU54946.1 hypothetical protein MUA11_11780 [Staphylococcus agnetis]UXU57233.1 hypothetical protein MUA95_11955 [Staphylococcus agnetis]